MLDLSHLRVVYQARTSDYIRYMLPDNLHCVEIYLSKYSVTCYVREDMSSREKVRFPITKDKAPHWEDLVHQFCELAHKNFPKQIRHGSVSPERQRRGW